MLTLHALTIKLRRDTTLKLITKITAVNATWIDADSNTAPQKLAPHETPMLQDIPPITQYTGVNGATHCTHSGNMCTGTNAPPKAAKMGDNKLEIALT